jgi:hypothetical protein
MLEHVASGIRKAQVYREEHRAIPSQGREILRAAASKIFLTESPACVYTKSWQVIAYEVRYLAKLLKAI